MKLKSTIIFFLCIICIFKVFGQSEVNLGTSEEFTTDFFRSIRKLKQARGEEFISEIKFNDTLTIKYKVNKVEEEDDVARVYGLLQAPHKGGVFIIKKGFSIEGDVFFANWNKALRFETRNGQVYLKQEDLRKIICEQPESEKPEDEFPTREKTAAPNSAVPTILGIDTRKLQSYPGAKAVIYIDFDGHMSGQRWANSYNGGLQFYLTPANISSDNEYSVWKVMSEDYKPFDINITTDSTVFHQYATNRRQRLVVTRNSSWQTLSTTGIAWVNGFSAGDDPCFSFPSGFSSSNPLSTLNAERLGEVSTHECGHTVGLSHDGTSTIAYYRGHGNWAPIMGSGYTRNVTQWSKGEYADANQLQDDLAIITGTTNGFGYKTDDCGNTFATSKPFVIATGGIVNPLDNNGVIERNTDIDVFQFTTSGGTISLHFGTALPKPNLDIKASLYNSSNQLITSSDIADITYADINTTLTEGSYYVTIEGVGYGDPLSTGYSKYASLGYYEISGTIPTTGTGNQYPIVTITAPINGTSFVAPGSITINATASDADGTISKVEFFNGATLLGSDNTSPYSYNWTGVVDGTYSLTAKATDDKGAVTASTVVSITVISVSNQSPVVSISSPTSETTYSAPANITINATATDTDGTISKVEFYNGTTMLSIDNSSPYTYIWTNVGAGTYTLSAKAYDDALAVTTSSSVTVTVNSATTGCTAPAWNSSTIYLGDAGKGTGMGEVVSYSGKQYRAQWWTQNQAPGTNSVWLYLGTCMPANQLPTVSITSPSNGATFTSPASITITANAADIDGTISKVEFYNGTTLLNYDATSPYTYTWTGVSAGTYSLTAKAYDNSGGVTNSSAISITVNPASNKLPTVSITSPSNGATFTAPASITITANAADIDGTISKVEFYNGTTLLNYDATSPYTYTWTGVSAGTYSLTAKAYDNSGGVTNSSVVSITVNPAANQLPTVTITSPSNDATFTAPASVTITANAADIDGTISKVEFYNGTTLLNSDATTPYSYTWTGVSAGTYSLTAKAYDNSGGVTNSSVVSITVTSEQTGTEDCSNVLAWNSNAIYVANDLVTYNGYKYKANYWTKNNDPSTSSNGQYDFWLKIGECINGTISSAGPNISMSPAEDTTVIKDDILELLLHGFTPDSIQEITFYLYDGITLISKINTTKPLLQGYWPANKVGEYTLQAVVKDNKGVSVFPNSISVKVAQPTSVMNYTISDALLVIPNPNNSRFLLSSPSVINLQGAKIELFSLTGNRVYESIFIYEGQEFAPENINAGFYILKVTLRDKFYMTKMEVY